MMHKSKIQNRLPELMPGNELKADELTSSPAIAKPHVVRSPLLKDYLHLYLGCNVFIDSPNAAFNKDILDCDLLERLYNDLPIELYKLIIRPLSSMTTEEAAECWKLTNTDREVEGWQVVDYFRREENFYEPKTFHYLLSKHFDLFGLIDNGIAIEAVSER